MISGGDELGRSQFGNNNAYCHDSPLTWTPFAAPDADQGLLEFVERLVALRTTSAVLRRRTFLAGRKAGGADVLWLRADAAEMTDPDWADPSRLSVGMLLDGTRIRELDHEGQPIVGDSLYVFLNASAHAVTITLPQVPSGGAWEHVLDTNDPGAPVATSAPATVQAVGAQTVRIYRG